MKKIFTILLLGIFVMSSFAYGASNFEAENAVILGPRMGAIGITPVSKLVKVRYGYEGGSTRTGGDLSSGDVVVWDTTSADGYTISASIAANSPAVAGVLVTAVSTSDSNNVRGTGRNIGYICVEGYCLAKVDTSASTAGERLTTATPDGETATAASFSTAPTTMPDSGAISADVGILLADTSADGLMRVYLF